MADTRADEQQHEQRRIAELESSVSTMARELGEAKQTIARLRARYQHVVSAHAV